MQNFLKKDGLEIWWKSTFLPNLVLICLTGSEKTGFTDGRPRDDSSSTVQWHKAELKMTLPTSWKWLIIQRNGANIWISVLVDHIFGNFALVLFKVIWGSFSALILKWHVTCRAKLIEIWHPCMLVKHICASIQRYLEVIRCIWQM